MCSISLKKKQSPAFETDGAVDEAEMSTTLFSSAMGAMASVSELATPPIITWTLSKLMSFLAASAAFAGSVPVSSKIRVTFLPLRRNL